VLVVKAQELVTTIIAIQVKTITLFKIRVPQILKIIQAKHKS
jgi:hypothetical protein